MRDEVDFLHVDKQQTLLQVYATNFGWQGQSCAKYPKISL